MSFNVNLQNLSALESLGLSKVFKAYANDTNMPSIDEVGFNANSGYVYIALEDGICICSLLGGQVEYLVTDFEDGTETFHKTYDKALKHLQTL